MLNFQPFGFKLAMLAPGLVGLQESTYLTEKSGSLCTTLWQNHTTKHVTWNGFKTPELVNGIVLISHPSWC